MCERTEYATVYGTSTGASDAQEKEVQSPSYTSSTTLLFVNKHQKSDSLTRSHGVEKLRVYRHVQKSSHSRKDWKQGSGYRSRISPQNAHIGERGLLVATTTKYKRRYTPSEEDGSNRYATSCKKLVVSNASGETSCPLQLDKHKGAAQSESFVTY